MARLEDCEVHESTPGDSHIFAFIKWEKKKEKKKEQKRKREKRIIKKRDKVFG